MNFEFKVKAYDKEHGEVASGIRDEDNLMEFLYNVKRFGAVEVRIAGKIKNDL